MSPEQIASKPPPPLDGPRIEADTPHIRLELNCLCGKTLESVIYMDGDLIKIVVNPCKCEVFK